MARVSAAPASASRRRGPAAMVVRYRHAASRNALLHETPPWAQYALTSGMVTLTFLVRHAVLGERDAYLYHVCHSSGQHGPQAWKRAAGGPRAVMIKLLLIPQPFSPWFSDPDDILVI